MLQHVEHLTSEMLKHDEDPSIDMLKHDKSLGNFHDRRRSSFVVRRLSSSLVVETRKIKKNLRQLFET